MKDIGFRTRIIRMTVHYDINILLDFTETKN